MTYKILLLEDDEAINAIYRRQFELNGLSTDAYLKGEEGLQALQKNNYAIILLDLMLSDINSLELLKRIKQNEQKKHIPVILLTNLVAKNILNEGIALGASGYLHKTSFAPDQIVKEVKRFLEQRT
jgi:CheY-like chemotaxis protein